MLPLDLTDNISALAAHIIVILKNLAAFHVRLENTARILGPSYQLIAQKDTTALHMIV